MIKGETIRQLRPKWVNKWPKSLTCGGGGGGDDDDDVIQY
jgi:hypothetical protein